MDREMLPAVIERQAGTDIIPAMVADAGDAACFVWEEFFSGEIRNPHTRRAYRHAVRRFLAWAAAEGFGLRQITPGLVGRYLDQLRTGTPPRPASIPTRKLHLAALRGFFDKLVLRHVVALNAAAAVRGERYQVVEGKTPEITVAQARSLLQAIRTGDAVGLRDRAVITIMIYTTARVGAVAKLRLRDLSHDGTQYTLRFDEKGGKAREIPVRHDLERFLIAYLDAAGLKDAPKDAPLFRTALRRAKTLTANAMTAGDMGRMVKRRMKDAGLPGRLSPHSFRVATITDLLNQGEPLDDAQ
jgi:integrase/recombinase XerD